MNQSSRPRRKRKNFSDLSTVLNMVVRKYGIDKRIREHTFMSMWSHVVGEPWSSLSRPVFFDHERNLVIAVRDSSVAQELTLRRSEIVTTLKKMAVSVGIKFKGVRFDIKSFARVKALEEEILEESSLDCAKQNPEPTAEDLKKVELSEEHLTELGNFKANLFEDNLNKDIVNRIFEIYERDLRRQIWLLNQEAKQCSSCGLPETRLHGKDGLCGPCFIESLESVAQDKL